ncbi:MAG: DUF1810 domain-containing protein [Prevotella sp.]|nr:DUF1810 domain-containing protein [Prevotella sp.]
MEDYDFNRFKEAQASRYNGYEAAVEEIRGGRRRTRWVWYVFPMLKGIGHSYNSDFYGFDDVAEARAFLNDAFLGGRLREATCELLEKSPMSVKSIFGVTDAFKVWSCMTLFDSIRPNDIFGDALDVFFNGKRESLTLKRLAKLGAQ